MSDIPPLTSVRAFEAVARQLSFTRAAAELGMSQAAVSYQIKLLEERIGAALFVRKARQVELSEVGQRLAPDVLQAFDILRNSFAQTHQHVSGTLAILSLPTFATRWFAANIGLFQVAHPDIAVRFNSRVENVDFQKDMFDVGIIASWGELPEGVVGHELLRAEFTPIMSGDFIERHRIREPRDLLRAPAISPSDQWIGQWFAMMGIDDYPAMARGVVTLDTQVLEAAAAGAGRGFAMITPALFRDDLASGRLVQPFPELGWDGCTYQLVYPQSRRNWTKVKVFREWILEATSVLRA
ncbi:LysR substrate-binding domain-containing protein [Devosia sp. MC1541]|uniref:LysR substrate-binding domain-containing protein n=1 Tax=Devosia sp. MC1541 TaxID=2725264 RepID=UPI00145C47A3|nr:LysR substrate-binding domain-containing protein [Devosia sp. MC1541]